MVYEDKKFQNTEIYSDNIYIEFIDSTGLNYIMFARNSVVLRNYNHPEISGQF